MEKKNRSDDSMFSPLENEIKNMDWGRPGHDVVGNFLAQPDEERMYRRNVKDRQADSFPIIPFMFALAACALAGILYMNHWEKSRRHDHVHVSERYAANGPEEKAAKEETFARFQAKYRLAGILSGEVVIEEIDTEKQRILKKGGMVDGFIVADIQNTKIILKNTSGEEFTWSMTSGTGTASETVVPSNAGSFLLQGTVYRNGIPVPDVWVQAFSGPRGTDMENRARRIAYKKTNAEGHYELQVKKKTVYLMTRVDSLTLFQEGPWAKDDTVDFNLLEDQLITLEGVVSMGDGSLLGGAEVSAYDGEKRMTVTTRTSANGAYQLRVNKDTAYLVASTGLTSKGEEAASMFGNPSTGQDWAQIRKNGPWMEDATVVFVFSKENFFILDGNLLNAKRESLYANSKSRYVEAYDKQGRLIQRVYSDSKNHYQLGSNMEIAYLLAYDNWMKIKKEGPWTQSATVDFDFAKVEVFVVEGSIRYGDGESAGESVKVYFYDELKNKLAATRTNQKGYYKVEIQNGIAAAYLTAEAVPVGGMGGPGLGYRPGATQLNGPWSKNSRVDIDFSKGDFKILEGTILDDNGKPASEVNITALAYPVGANLQTHSDSNGYFRLQFINPINSLSFVIPILENGQRLNWIQINKQGPWDESEIINIDASKLHLFTMDGVVTDVHGGKPLAGVRVSAGAEGSFYESSITNAEGYFKFRTASKVNVLHARLNPNIIKKEGPWNQDATVNMVFFQEGYFSLEGTILHADGTPASLRILPCDEEGNVLVYGYSDKNGYYQFKLTKQVAYLNINESADSSSLLLRKDGPWSKDTTIDITLPAIEYYTIEGTVRYENGDPVEATVFANYEGGGDAWQGLDENGKYRLRIMLGKKVVNIFVQNRVGTMYKWLDGEWVDDTVLDISVKKDE